MSQPIDMNNNFIENLITPTASDHATNKSYVDAYFLSKSGDLMSGAISMGGFRIRNMGLPINNNNDAANKGYVTNQLNTKLDKAADIDMKNKKITALTTDAADVQSATNISYVKNEVNLSAKNIITILTDRFDRKINQSHISSSTNKQVVFRYLMEVVNESSSENNIIVDGISDFSRSPHNVNKKASVSKWEKGHKINILLELASTCSNCRKASTLWQLNFSHQA